MIGGGNAMVWLAISFVPGSGESTHWRLIGMKAGKSHDRCERSADVLVSADDAGKPRRCRDDVK